MTVRAKVKLIKETKSVWYPQGKELHFECMYDQSIPEDQRFQKATPSGHITLQIDNPVALDKFKPGNSYYVDFTPAE